jgi:hypothetical protein
MNERLATTERPIVAFDVGGTLLDVDALPPTCDRLDDPFARSRCRQSIAVQCSWPA